jgi:vancomycin resistance protein VanW
MSRKLFCEISPLTYEISTKKEQLLRDLQNFITTERFACKKYDEPLPVLIYRHNSLIRRKLGNTEPELQEGKAVNLSIAAPLINGIIINPGETFAFWRLVGNPTAKRGYKTGLTIKNGKPDRDVGGGMCQLTNLIHYMVLHSPLEVTEYHHHNNLDLFPDYGRQVPFGTGTSVLYNYLDYRFINKTDAAFQLILSTDAKYLRGELRSDTETNYKYHIKEEDSCFVKTPNGYRRQNKVYRTIVDKHTGITIEKTLICESDAKVMYPMETDAKESNSVKTNENIMKTTERETAAAIN